MSIKAHPNINAAGLMADIIGALTKYARGGVNAKTVLHPAVLGMSQEFCVNVSLMLDLIAGGMTSGFEVSSEPQEVWLGRMLAGLEGDKLGKDGQQVVLSETERLRKALRAEKIAGMDAAACAICPYCRGEKLDFGKAPKYISNPRVGQTWWHMRDTEEWRDGQPCVAAPIHFLIVQTIAEPFEPTGGATSSS